MLLVIGSAHIRTPFLEMPLQGVEQSGKLKLVASQPGNWDRLTALDAAGNIMRAHPDLKAFYANNDTEGGRPVRTRFIWSQITPTSCHWEQAESTDGGKTWETDWIQDLVKVL